MRAWRLALACVVIALAAAPAAPAAAQRRVALVVGNAAYRHVPVLANPGNDARAIAAALVRLGFDTDLVVDADRAAMEAAVRRLGDRAAGADAALFFYAGHAVEVAGRNYLVPISANVRSARDLPFETLDFDALLTQVEGRARVALILLDSCRDNPFRALLGTATRGVVRAGIAAVQSATGTLIAFATAPGQVAQDGSGLHSPFTAALLEHIETPGLEIRQMLARVRKSVREATGGQQVPWETSALEGEVLLRTAAVTPPPPRPGAARSADLPAIGATYEARFTLPDGTVPLPPGRWRLVGVDARSLSAPANFRRSSATLVQERDGRAVAVLMLRLRTAAGPRAEQWPRYACSQRSALARRVVQLSGDRLDCHRVGLWAPVVAPDGPLLRDTEALFEEARARIGWLPGAMLIVGAVRADADRQAAYDLHLDPVAFGFAADDRPAAASSWGVERLDDPRKACIAALAAWAERLRNALRAAADGKPAGLPAATCRAASG